MLEVRQRMRYHQHRGRPGAPTPLWFHPPIRSTCLVGLEWGEYLQEGSALVCLLIYGCGAHSLALSWLLEMIEAMLGGSSTQRVLVIH